MFTQLIKSVTVLICVSTLLVACSSSGTKDPAAGVDTGIKAPTTTSSGTVQNTVVENTSVDAPTGNVFYFDFNSSVLNFDSRSLLSQHAAALKASPRSIRLEGHADERGTREYNIALGERRAQTVRTYLQSEGVTSPIEIISYGEERPEVDSSNETAWQQNRRVELK